MRSYGPTRGPSSRPGLCWPWMRHHSLKLQKPKWKWAQQPSIPYKAALYKGHKYAPCPHGFLHPKLLPMSNLSILTFKTCHCMKCYLKDVVCTSLKTLHFLKDTILLHLVDFFFWGEKTRVTSVTQQSSVPPEWPLFSAFLIGCQPWHWACHERCMPTARSSAGQGIVGRARQAFQPCSSTALSTWFSWLT